MQSIRDNYSSFQGDFYVVMLIIVSTSPCHHADHADMPTMHTMLTIDTVLTMETMDTSFWKKWLPICYFTLISVTYSILTCKFLFLS